MVFLKGQQRNASQTLLSWFRAIAGTVIVRRQLSPDKLS
jgi:hypothetical protein